MIPAANDPRAYPGPHGYYSHRVVWIAVCALEVRHWRWLRGGAA